TTARHFQVRPSWGEPEVHHAKVDVNLWIWALECLKSTGRITTAGVKRLKSNCVDFAFRADGEYLKTRTKKAHLARDRCRCSGSPAAMEVQGSKRILPNGSTSRPTFGSGHSLNINEEPESGEQSSWSFQNTCSNPSERMRSSSCTGASTGTR